jgi:hypothetical protein
LLAIWHQFEFVGLSPLHAWIIFWSMSNDNDKGKERLCRPRS